MESVAFVVLTVFLWANLSAALDGIFQRRPNKAAFAIVAVLANIGLLVRLWFA